MELLAPPRTMITKVVVGRDPKDISAGVCWKHSPRKSMAEIDSGFRCQQSVKGRSEDAGETRPRVDGVTASTGSSVAATLDRMSCSPTELL